jgi:MFS family permease
MLTGLLLGWATWRAILVGSAIPVVVMGLLIGWLLRRSKEAMAASISQSANAAVKAKSPMSPREYLRNLGRLLVNPAVFCLSLISAIRALTQNGLSTFLPSFFMNLMHISPWLSGVYMTVIQIAGIIAAPVAGRVSDRLGRKRVVRASLVTTSLGIFLLVLLNVPWLFVAFLGVVGFFLFAVRPVLMAWAMEVAPKELGGAVVGIQFGFQSGFAALAPVIGGWIADTWGLIYTFYFLAATILVSNFLVYFVPEPARTEEAQISR